MKATPTLWFEPQHWIDGKWHLAGTPFEVRNPATGSVICQVRLADAATVRAAIDGADAAFEAWSSTSPFERGEILKKLASLLLARKAEFAALLTSEQGKPFLHARAEVEYAASFFQWYGEEARRVCGRIAPHPDPAREFRIEPRAVGVAGLITPWNFPLAQGAKKIGAALAAGCTVVWKPSELTPLVALALAPLFREAGLPDGVLQIVPGLGPTVGGVLADDPRVGVLSLTGSAKTGAALMAAAAPKIKRVALELGGNAPFIVLPCADLDLVCSELVQQKLFVSGQVCVAANRIFVHESVHAELLARLAERLAAMRVGNGLEEGVDVGPLIHRDACERVAAFVREAVGLGAEVVFENRSFERDTDLCGGSFFPPTLLSGVHDGMRLVCEEVFGPVLSVLQYADLDEVVRRANDTPHRLSAYVYGTDLSEAYRVASRLEFGVVGVNEWRPLKAENPFGGRGQSGIGVEGGPEGVSEFLETRVLSVPKAMV